MTSLRQHLESACALRHAYSRASKNGFEYTCANCGVITTAGLEPQAYESACRPPILSALIDVAEAAKAWVVQAERDVLKNHPVVRAMAEALEYCGGPILYSGTSQPVTDAEALDAIEQTVLDALAAYRKATSEKEG